PTSTTARPGTKPCFSLRVVTWRAILPRRPSAKILPSITFGSFATVVPSLMFLPLQIFDQAIEAFTQIPGIAANLHQLPPVGCTRDDGNRRFGDIESPGQERDHRRIRLAVLGRGVGRQFEYRPVPVRSDAEDSAAPCLGLHLEAQPDPTGDEARQPVGGGLHWANRRSSRTARAAGAG